MSTLLKRTTVALPLLFAPVAAPAQEEKPAVVLQPISMCEMLVTEGADGETLNRLLASEGCSDGQIQGNILRQESYGRKITEVCRPDADECYDVGEPQ